MKKTASSLAAERGVSVRDCMYDSFHALHTFEGGSYTYKRAADIDQIRDEVHQEGMGKMQQELLKQRHEQKLEMEEMMKRFMSKQPPQSSHTPVDDDDDDDDDDNATS